MIDRMNVFTELIGQNRAVELLEQAALRDRIAPAYLFAGPSGVGRTLAARCWSERLIQNRTANAARRLQAGNHPDFLWVQPTYLHQGKHLTASEAAAAGLKRKAPPQIRIEQIRELTQFLNRPPLEASRSVVVIEEAQTMTEAAANALLKTLEEPGQATLILIAPGTDALLPTLVSRCQVIPFYRLSQEQMTQVLRKGHEEIINDATIMAIAQGSPGDAIAAFEQLQTIPQNLLQNLVQPPCSPLDALALAKEVEGLETTSQLWLVDYLQYCYWQAWRSRPLIEQLEKARQCLLNYVCPRLVWESTLISICQLELN